MKYINITSPDVNNGEGCRVTIWFAGCPHHCPGCHNSSTWSYNQGKEMDDDFYEKIILLLKKPYIKGLTLSGGDPLGQSEEDLKELYNFVRWVKRKTPQKDIWIYTGYTKENLKGVQLDILEYCDVLVDGPFIQELCDKTLPFRGSSNQRIIQLH